MKEHADLSFPDAWYAVAAGTSLRRRPLKVRRLGEDLVLWRDRSGRPSCLPASCPHRGADLSRGRVRGDDLQCPYHGFRFDADGTCVLTPCEDPGASVPKGLRAQTRPVREEHGVIWLWWGSTSPTDIPWFPEMDTGVSVATVTSSYPCHFTRFMENSLDVHHFAFVHRRVLPFVGSVVEVDGAELRGDLIRSEGRIVPAPGELLRRASTFRLDAVFPGLVHLDALGFELLVAACPVDETATWVAAQYLRPRLGSAPLSRATSWLAAWADLLTAQRQDKRILRGIRPLTGSPRDNTAVGADRALSLWYKRLAQCERTDRPPPRQARFA